MHSTLTAPPAASGAFNPLIGPKACVGFRQQPPQRCDDPRRHAVAAALAATVCAALPTRQRSKGVQRTALSHDSSVSVNSHWQALGRLSRRSIWLSPLLASNPLAAAAAAAAGGVPKLTLKGAKALVTGASSGIGKGIAIGLGERGATVFVTGRRPDATAEVAKLVTEAGGKGVAIQCDHSKDDQVEKAFQAIAAQSGGELNILVNNVFQAPDTNPEIARMLNEGAKFYELPLTVWDDMHTVGLRSHYVASRLAAPMLIKAARASTARPLLCTTSSFGGVAPLFTPAYGVGKAASDRMIRDFQVELGPQGIDCVSLWPGLVLTERVEELLVKDPRRISRLTGGQDVYQVAETPVLTGRVIAQLAVDETLRSPPYVTPDGLTGRICIVAEAARALSISDGGAEDTVAGRLYGKERTPAPSMRSLGFLVPGPLRQALPESLKWIADPSSPLASYDTTLPLEFMAQGPPPGERAG